jgi:branched-chain amino acid transport system permease protein
MAPELLAAPLIEALGRPVFLITFAGGINWTVGFLTTVAIFAILALALNLQWGYTGVFNFGVVAFFMVGAYTSALLTLSPASGGFQRYILGLELPVPVGWLGGALAGALLALLIGLPTLRLRRDFLAIATIGVAAILRSVANTADGFVNRSRGLHGVPRLMGDTFDAADYRYLMLFITLLAAALVFLAVYAMTASPWGRVLRAIRDNEATAQSVGKRTVVFRMQSFVIGGAIMGFAGALYAHRVGSIAPEAFNDLFGTFLIWAMVIVGGSGNFKGALVGALAVGFFWFGVPLIQEQLPRALGANVFVLRQFLIGLLIVAFILFLPRGLIAEEARVSRFVPGPARGPSLLARLRVLGRRAPAGAPASREP